MMNTTLLFLLFIKGVLVGLMVSAPVGPVGVLCIRRTLSGRYGLSIVTGLGAAVADAVYAAMAGFSLVSIAEFMSQYNFYLRIFGGSLVVWIGFSIFRTPFKQVSIKTFRTETFLQGFTSAFFVTISNPIVFIVFAAAFTALGISPAEDSLSQGFSLVGGVLLGATGWWVALSMIMFLIHHKVSSEHLFWINRISGVMLLGFGGYMLLSVVIR